ncbi:MAG TPA: hypothetical protein VIV60_18755 [Polyangiaceae bacterium]
MARNLQFVTLLVALIALAISPGCRNGAPAFVQLNQARQTTADLRIQFAKEVDASNRAVMAESDEASIAFAHEAQQASQTIEKGILSLASQFTNLHFPLESRLLGEFEHHFSEYLVLDRSILELAVENTNLKAQRLSFGASREAANSFRKSLEPIISAVATKDRCRADALAVKAALAVSEIQVLQAPHIAEADAAVMSHMEEEMDTLMVTTKEALGELSGLVGSKARGLVAHAQEELRRFKEISDQIVALSHRNSNVRSLDLALRARPPMTATCDDSLRAIQDALTNEGSKATR